MPSIVHREPSEELSRQSLSSLRSGLCKALDPFLCHHFSNAVDSVSILLSVLVKLKPCFDKPYGVCSSGCGYPSGDSSLCMEKCGIVSVTESAAESLAAAIRIEFDCSRRNYARDTRCETAEKAGPTF